MSPTVTYLYPTVNYMYSLIWTPQYYAQLALSLEKESPHIFSKFNLLNTETPLTRTLSMAPTVSVLTRCDRIIYHFSVSRACSCSHFSLTLQKKYISTYLHFLFVQSHSMDLKLYQFTRLTINACILPGQGANVILDCVGSSFWEQNIKSIAVDGRWILYGLLGGNNVSGNLLGPVLKKRVSLIGTTLKSRPLAVSYYSLKY